jgi:hypothetical protein
LDPFMVIKFFEETTYVGVLAALIFGGIFRNVG